MMSYSSVIFFYASNQVLVRLWPAMQIGLRMTDAVPRLQGSQVTLRAPRATDLDERLALGRQPAVVRLFGSDLRRPTPLPPEVAAAWLERLSRHPQAWIIEVEGRLLGEIRLDNVDRHDRRASLAIGLFDPAELGRGLGSEAVRLMLAYAFTELALHRVSARVLADNARAIRCYEKCGFTVEGRERQAALVAGEWHDDLIMGILEPDWRRAVSDILPPNWRRFDGPC
jgi:RimJ/RimL family protein N-acetyltransferase